MLWGLIVGLLALLLMRLFFASVRRVANRGAAEPGSPRGPAGGPSSGTAPGKRSPRRRGIPHIDRSTAEDVPFVEVETEGAARG